MSAVTQDFLVLVLLFSIVTLGLDLVVGYVRIFSINQAVLFGVGAFTYAGAVTHLHSASMLLSWAIAIPVAALLSAIVALVSLRVSGDYFVVASFGFQLVALQALYNWTDLSGGAAGVFALPYPSLLGWAPTGVGSYLLLAAGVCALAYLLVLMLVRSPYGRLMRALGEDESALAAAGFSILRLKVATFMLGGALAAVSGVLYAGYLGVAQVSDYSLDVSISLLAMVVVGGAGRIVGGLLGAALLVLVPRGLDLVGVPTSVAGSLQQALFGGLLVLVMLFLPGGLAGLAALLRPARWRSADHRSAPEASA